MTHEPYGEHMPMSHILIPKHNMGYLTQGKQYHTIREDGTKMFIYDDEGVTTEINLQHDHDLYEVINIPYRKKDDV